jgi:hypothetical protein
MGFARIVNFIDTETNHNTSRSNQDKSLHDFPAMRVSKASESGIALESFIGNASHYVVSVTMARFT